MPEPSIEEIEAKAAQGGIRKAAWAERYPDSLSDQRGAISDPEKSNTKQQEEAPKPQKGAQMTEKTKFATKEEVQKYATKEEVQKEQKDLRSFLLTGLGVIIGSIALCVAIAGISVSQGLNASIDSSEKSLKADISSLGSKIDANEKVATIYFDKQQKQMDEMNAVLLDIQKKMNK